MTALERLVATQLLFLVVNTASAADTPERPDTNNAVSIDVGAGAERLPSWLGAATHKTHAIPYFDLSWGDIAELSSTDGLRIDWLHDEHWHSGVIGTVQWGRSGKDLGRLADSGVPTLDNTLQAGAYLEYAFNKNFDAGLRVRHDLQGTGAAYGEVYSEWDLPAPQPFEHGIKVSTEAMNGAAMWRFFGLTQETAAALGTSAYQPHGGLARTSLAYQVMMPTSQHSGILLAIEWSRLQGAAANSPLVRSFGARIQRDISLAAVYHF